MAETSSKTNFLQYIAELTKIFKDTKKYYYDIQEYDLVIKGIQDEYNTIEQQLKAKKKELDRANTDYETARLKLIEKQGELQEIFSKRVINPRIQSIPKRVNGFVPRDSYDSRAGHSHREDNRPRNYRNPKDIPCRNGTSCVRRDCKFSHPE